MSPIAYIRSLLASLLHPSRVEREMDEELRLHIESRADDLTRSGLDRDEAVRRARIEFGGYQKYREESREVLGTRISETLFQDVRFGLRMLRKSPGFTAVAVLTLALGIGANAAMFTVINAVMIRMLPVQDPQRLVAVGDPSRVHSWSDGTPRTDLFSYPLYRELRESNEVFSSVLASAGISTLRVEISGGPEKAEGRLVTENYFETLGVKPLLGRTFAGEGGGGPGSDPYLVISYGYWERRFSGDPSTVGRTVRLNGYPFTIIGVAPPGFFGEVVGEREDLWVPMMMEPQLMPGRNYLETANTSTLLMIGRLKPGITIEQARANVNAVVKRALTETLTGKLSSDDREVMKKGKLTVEVSPGGRGLSRLREEFSSPLLLLTGLVALVLLVACVNVANLMLARSAARERELAVRLAIGATRWRIVSQLLTEAVLLSLIGGACGLLAANWGSIALVRLANQGSADPLVLSLDWRVIGFTAGVSLIVGLLFGLAPAMRFVKGNLSPTLKEGGRDAAAGGRRGRVGSVLLSFQIALGVLVLIAAGLFVHSLRNLQEANLGYSRDRLVLVGVDPTASGYKASAMPVLTNELIGRVAALPGVRGATASANGLFSGSESSDEIRVEGYSSTKSEDLGSYDDQVGPNYFSTIGVPIVKGREINEQDFQGGARVAVVNESFAKFYFGDRNPLGYKVFIQDSDHPNKPGLEIIGVARDIHDHGVKTPVRRRLYAPLSSGIFNASGALNLEVRAVGNPDALVNEIREGIREQDANLVITYAKTENELVDQTLVSQILVAKLSSFFGALVLLLVCVGLYGSMSYGVATRTREIGVRMALGASRGKVVWMVTREVCVVVAIGAAAGIAGGIAATRFFRTMLFGVSAADPLAIGMSILTLIFIAFAAAVLPARRATKVDPMIALRYE